MKIKILYCIEGISFGGGSRSFLDIAINLPRDRFEVSMACHPDGPLSEMLKSTDIRHFPIDFSRKYNIFLFQDMVRIIREARPHIVHTQGSRVDFYGRLSAWLEGVPGIVSTFVVPFEQYGISWAMKYLYQACDFVSRATVSQFITVSDHLKDILFQQYRIKPGKIERIYNGVDLHVFDPAEKNVKSIKKSFHFKQDSVIIGTVGRLVPMKGINVFLDALKTVAQEYPHIQGLVIGDGLLRTDYERQAQSLGLWDVMLFTGFTRHIPDLLSIMDVFVLPSYREGNPLALLEAMAMGRCIVTSDFPGVREVVQDHISACIVPPGNSRLLGENILKLIHDRGKAQRMGQRAREAAQTTYAIDKAVSAHEQVYLNAVTA